MIPLRNVLLAAALALVATAAGAQLSVTVKDIGPDRSNNSDPNGATGGRVNRLGVDRSTPSRAYAASEFGGLFRSNDGGVTWFHLDGHVPTATQDVKVDPTNSNRVYATSLFDGRVTSRSGINISRDAGVTWTHPASAAPPSGLCENDVRRRELAAFRIAVDPANASHVFIGTNCGLAISTDAGLTWTFNDPTPGDAANDVVDVVVHHGGIIDVCGDDGHLRSTDGGTTWTTSSTLPLPTGQCSIVASPDESHVLFATVGTSIFESDDGGQNWANNYVNPSPQGRIPFVKTNKRSGANYDLWFGDVSLFRGACTTPNPANPGGAQRCAASASWAGGFTSSSGAHDDSGDIAFAPGVSANACPTLFSSDGGVFRNTSTGSPGCHAPSWTQPNVTPHALWEYSFSGVSRPGAVTEHLYLGNQDNGSFGATNGGAAFVSWNNERCCDGFDSGGDAARGLSTICCFLSGRATRLSVSGPGLTGASPEIGNYPAGNLRGFEQLETIVNFGANAYAIAMSGGVFVTSNIGASTITWTQLGAGSTPSAPCGLQFADDTGTPTFFVKSGGCDGDRQGRVFRYAGASAGGTWTQVPAPGPGGFGVFAVDPHDRRRLIASHLGSSGPRMVMTHDGGATWNGLAALDALMTGSGTFAYQNQTGPTAFASLSGYPQPTLVAFDRSDPDILVAGGADSGVFISTNGGARWQLVTDPISPGASGVPHIPRPYYAHFDHDPPGGDINLFLGTRGRGPWRLTFKKVAMPAIQVPAPPLFAQACRGDSQNALLNVCNTSAADLVVNSITSSNPEFAVVPASAGFPVVISHDFCFPFQVTFRPLATGTRTADITIVSNDPSFPALRVAASAVAGQPTAVTVIADSGNFGEVCVRPNAFKDLGLTVDNRGSCPLSITAITSSSAEFVVPRVLTFPIAVAPGDNIVLPIRFVPATAGAKTATITLSTNDPSAPAKIVSVSASVPPAYVCSPPLFASIDTAAGPAFGTGQTGGYTVNASGHVLASFGPEHRFAVQAQGEGMYFPRRREGQTDLALLYRRGGWQASLAGSLKTASLRAELEPGELSQVTLSLDRLLPSIRVGAFLSKGIKDSDVVGSSVVLGLIHERVMHTVDSAGLNLQANILPPLWWLDANVALLQRHAPGAGNTAGGGLRVSREIQPWLVGFVQLDVNESFIAANTVGTVTIGVSLGHWPRPRDYSNPVNPLGSSIPRVHYEVFDRVR